MKSLVSLFLLIGFLSGQSLVWDINFEAGNITKDGADLISAVTDLSSSGNDLSQATSGNQPKWFDNQLNGYPAARFTGSSTDFMDAASHINLTAYTIFTVIKFSEISSESWIGNKSTNVSLIRLTNSTAFLTRGESSTAITVNSSITLETDTYYLLTFVFDNTDQTAYVDNALAGSATDGNASYSFSRIGARLNLDYLTGDLVAIKIYDGAMNTADREAVESSLNSKYNLGISALAEDEERGFKTYGGFKKY